jgi:hypothetical protein
MNAAIRGMIKNIAMYVVKYFNGKGTLHFKMF